MDDHFEGGDFGSEAMSGVVSLVARQPAVCVLLLDAQGIVTAISHQGRRLLDLSQDEVVGVPWVEFWQGQARTDAEALMAGVRAGRPGSFRGLFRHGDHVSHWLVDAMPFETEAAGVRSVLVVSRLVEVGDEMVSTVPGGAEPLEGLSPLLHAFANLSAVVNGAARLLRAGVTTEVARQIAEGLAEAGTAATTAMDAYRADAAPDNRRRA